jgi:hypothetical protein
LGWFYLSTVLDDFSRYIIAWNLCTTMRAEDVTATLEMALDAAGLDKVSVLHRPRLLSDNGSSYISDDLAKWLQRHDMAHRRSAPEPAFGGAFSCKFAQRIVDGLRLTECDDSAISRHGVSLLSGGSGRAWQKRDLSARRYVYVWADGVYLQARTCWC